MLAGRPMATPDCCLVRNALGLRHVFEVHAINAGDRRRGSDYCRRITD